MIDWIKSKLGNAEPESPEFLWARVNPNRPHASISELADAPASNWLAGIKITGCPKEAAEHYNLLGRVVDWHKFTDAEQIAIKRMEYSIPLSKLMKHVRK